MGETERSTSIFATVGTTSFDDFVQSLCSLPFLTAMSNHHFVNYCLLDASKEESSPFASPSSSSPLPSAALSSSALPAPGPPTSLSLTSSSSSPLADSTRIHSLREEKEPSLELAIQYGRGRCPLSFLPPALLGSPELQLHGVNDADSSGSIELSIPIESMLAGENRGMPRTDASGSSRTTPITTQRFHRVLVRWFRFQPSLSAEMQSADLILTHAGAGTLLEALAISSSIAKPKIVNAVINSKLMNNHQPELAEELERRRHILVTRDCKFEWTTEQGATTFWAEVERFSPKLFLGGLCSRNDQSSFQRIVDGVMGFHHETWNTVYSNKKSR